MLPIYISYFAGEQQKELSQARTVVCALGFVTGFTLVFVTLGIFAGSIGLLLRQHMTIVNLVTGGIVVLFGLNFIGVLRIGFLNATRVHKARVTDLSFFSALLFGIVFSVGWTPCVGAFLGSALMLASQQGSALYGLLLLLCYSLGLGIPFVVSAVLIHRLKSTFDWIKAHYRVINIVSGSLLVVIGVLMMTGYMGYFLSLLAF